MDPQEVDIKLPSPPDNPVYTNILTNDKWHADLVSIRLITTSWQVYVIAQA